MNEFDTFVRQQVKPLAYVRYGDDFILFCRTKAEANQARATSMNKLDMLGLTINDVQDQTVRAWQGLHFLGHVINGKGATIIKKTQGLMMRRINLRNISSYSSLKLSEETKRILPWTVDL